MLVANLLEAIPNAIVRHLSLHLGQCLQTGLQHINWIHSQCSKRSSRTSRSERHKECSISRSVILARTILVQRSKQREVDDGEGYVTHHGRCNSFVQSTDALLTEQRQRNLTGGRFRDGLAS